MTCAEYLTLHQDRTAAPELCFSVRNDAGLELVRAKHRLDEIDAAPLRFGPRVFIISYKAILKPIIALYSHEKPLIINC